MIESEFDNESNKKLFNNIDHFHLFDLYISSRKTEKEAAKRIFEFFEQHEIKIRHIKVKKDMETKDKNMYVAYIFLENINHALCVYNRKIKFNFKTLSDSEKYTPRLIATRRLKSLIENHSEFKEKSKNSNKHVDKSQRSNSRSVGKFPKTENNTDTNLNPTCSIPEIKKSDKEENKDSFSSELKKEDPVICDKMEVEQTIKEPCETQINIIVTYGNISEETLVLNEDVNLILMK
jgi:hypothetical protein